MKSFLLGLGQAFIPGGVVGYFANSGAVALALAAFVPVGAFLVVAARK